jgi:GDP-4-dehydro-6-deoxy-D-mannose reductase
MAVLRRVQPDWVFHLAALIKSSSFSDLMAVNVIGTEYLLEAIRSVRPEARVLVAGSAAEYGLCYPEEMPLDEQAALRPLSPYGISKVAQSCLAASYAYRFDLAVVRTRTFNLTGPGEPDNLVVGAFARQIALIEHGLQKPLLQVGNLESARDFVDIRDAVRAYVELMDRGQSGQVYNVCSGQTTVIRELLSTLLSFSDQPIVFEEVEGRLTGWDIPIQRGTPAALQAATDWQARFPLSQSLRETVNSWRQRVSNM